MLDRNYVLELGHGGTGHGGHRLPGRVGNQVHVQTQVGLSLNRLQSRCGDRGKVGAADSVPDHAPRRRAISTHLAHSQRFIDSGGRAGDQTAVIPDRCTSPPEAPAWYGLAGPAFSQGFPVGWPFQSTLINFWGQAVPRPLIPASPLPTTTA